MKKTKFACGLARLKTLKSLNHRFRACRAQKKIQPAID